jgi:hypothetical protein
LQNATPLQVNLSGQNLVLTAAPTNTGAAPPGANTTAHLRMSYALSNLSTGATVYSGSNSQIGALSAATNGAITALTLF